MQRIIYITLFTLTFILSSCFGGDEEKVNNPYAALRNFSLDDMVRYDTVKVDNLTDSVVKIIVPGDYYPFVINQKTKQVYNSKPLPFNTDISKVSANVENDGVLYVYNDTLEKFEYFSSSDSLNYTAPKRFMVASLDAEYKQEYTVTVNIYDKDPECISWNKGAKLAVAHPLCAVEKSGALYLFGKQDNGEQVVSSIALDAPEAWGAVQTISGLPEAALLERVLLFGDSFYVVADGALYSSSDGAVWTVTATDRSISELLFASENELWAISSADSISRSLNAADFEQLQALPSNFPVNNISSAVYPLRTNPYISRFILVGYSNESKVPVVWSKLSNENGWVSYSDGTAEAFSCPSFENMSVLYYDSRLYAFGGAAKQGNNNIAPFSAFYVSTDNGLTWVTEGVKAKLPDALLGATAPYTAVVDSYNYIWIIQGGDEPSVWRGILNRFEYEARN